MLKAIKIRLYPDNEQINYLSNLFGSCRFVYNKLLSFKISEYNNNKHSVSFSEMGKQLIYLKSENEWLKNSHSKVLQQSLIDLDKAYKNFFKEHRGFPNFKSKHDNKQSCRFPIDAISGIKGNRINIINQLKNVHFKCSRQDEIYLNKYQKQIKSGTLNKTKSGEYYFSILLEDTRIKKLKDSSNIIGIDLGIKDFVITSDGETFENIKIKRNNQKKLNKLHKQLSRKKKGSKNREKCRIKLAKFYEKLNNKKENYLHSVVNSLLNENQVIVMEDLNVSGMMKNHKLSKSIQELSLYRLKVLLKYKAEWYRRDIIEIDRYYPSSKLCNVCNYKNNDLSLSDRVWICPICGTKHDRDHNAALNIKNEGIKILSTHP
jgi:putative transposase